MGGQRVQQVEMEKICLNIESAGHRLGIALTCGEELIEEMHLDQPYAAPGSLLPMIRGLLEKKEIRPSDIGLIAVDVGPGSFTGLRAGIAAAQGLAFGLNCPLIGISAFQALAKSAQRKNETFPLSILLDSRREDPFAAILDEECRFLMPPCVLLKEDLDSWRNQQPHLLANQAHLAANWRFVDPYDVGLLALSQNCHLPPHPVYMRDPEITKARPK